MRAYYWRRREHFRDVDRQRYLAANGGIVECECKWCSTTFTTTAQKRKGHDVQFCSRACKDAAYSAAAKQALEQSKPVRSCRHCGAEMPQSMRADAAYCSAACNLAAHNQTRKASQRTGAKEQRIDRAYIIKRDSGRCHICGEVPQGRDITIDHVIPLARGGTHTPENLRVACLSCNCAKRDRGANDQLMLVG